DRLTFVERARRRLLAPTQERPESEPERTGLGEDGRRILLPDRRLDVDVELDLVAVRILDVETVGDGVIGGPDEPSAGRYQLVASLAEFGVGFSNLEAEMVHADPAPARDRRRLLPHLDQQQLVVGTPRRKGSGRKADLLAGDRDLLPAQHITIRSEERRVGKECSYQFVEEH